MRLNVRQTLQRRRRLLQHVPRGRVRRHPTGPPAGFLQLVAVGPRGPAGVPGSEPVARGGGAGVGL